MSYQPAPDRYERIPYRRCGRSGLKLPAISLGCWHNFGGPGTGPAGLDNEAEFHENSRDILLTAFDHGITHFDLANNYGPPPGAAEERVGRILREDLSAHRDELIISSKAGFYMWPGPYGEWGSRKNLLASLDQSLRRLKLDYVDIFYHHRPDPDTPVEETMDALDSAVRSGKALYAGISNYSGAATAQALRAARRHGGFVPVIHQPNYSLLSRWIETDLLPVAQAEGIGVIAFCPLQQGLLSDKYLQGIPADSRVASASVFLKEDSVTDDLVARLQKLNAVAQERGQTLAQLALTWVLRQPGVTSALIGASRPGQIDENVQAASAAPLTEDELARLDSILA